MSTYLLGNAISLSLLILEPFRYSDQLREFFCVQVKQKWFQRPLSMFKVLYHVN